MTARTILTALLVALIAQAARAEDSAGREIEPWRPGMLDIHQISTGRGNAGLFVFPDGTTLLVDAGELATKTPRYTPDRPDGSRSAGEWIVRYVQHALRHDPRPALDYLLLTHFHDDHMGSPGDDSPESAEGKYKLSGVTRVADSLRVGKLLDRAWPDYQPLVPDGRTMKNFRAFLNWQTEHNGLKVERFAPGRNDQVVLLRQRQKYPQFEFRNVGVNGEIWTGVGTNTRQHFPDLQTVPPEDQPSENMLCTSFRLSYGRFDYYNGGDILGLPAEGAPPWHDVETPVAKAVGPVDAAIVNHHAYIDSQNAFFVATLRPRVWIISIWSAGQPGLRAWNRLRSTRLYPGPRDIFATDVHPAAALVNKTLDRLTSSHGHVVLRVSPGGDDYRVVIVDDTSESHKVTSVFGPYPSR